MHFSLNDSFAGDDWSDEDDAEFEARLAALRTAKGAVPMGQSRKGKEKKDPEMPTYVRECLASIHAPDHCPFCVAWACGCFYL